MEHCKDHADCNDRLYKVEKDLAVGKEKFENFDKRFDKIDDTLSDISVKLSTSVTQPQIIVNAHLLDKKTTESIKKSWSSAKKWFIGFIAGCGGAGLLLANYLKDIIN